MSVETKVELLRAPLKSAEMEGPVAIRVLWDGALFFSCFAGMLAYFFDTKVAVVVGAVLSFLFVFFFVIRQRKVGVDALFPSSEVWSLPRGAALSLYDKSFQLAAAEDDIESAEPVRISETERSELREQSGLREQSKISMQSKQPEARSYEWSLTKGLESDSRTITIIEIDKKSLLEQRVILKADFDQVDNATHVLVNVDVAHAATQSPVIYHSMISRLARLRAQLRLQLIQRSAIAADGIEKSWLYKFHMVKYQILSQLKIKNLSVAWALYFVFYTLIIIPCVCLDFGKRPLWYILATDVTPLILSPGILFYAMKAEKAKLILAWRFVVPLAIIGEMVNIGWQCNHLEIFDQLDNFHAVLTILQYEIVIAIPAIYANFKFAYKKN